MPFSFAFDFIILGAGEAVFTINGEHRIYTIKGINALRKKYSDDDSVLTQLNIASAALFDDANLELRWLTVELLNALDDDIKGIV